MSSQGALKKALGGSIRSAVGKAAGVRQQASTPVKGGGLRGALGRVMGQKNPQPPKGNHMMRNAGPIKAELLSGTDTDIAETGDGLRKVVGRVASRGRVAAAKGGRIKKYAEGGKVGTAMSALQALAKKYQEALEMGDEALARRIKRDIDLRKRESERVVEKPDPRSERMKKAWVGDEERVGSEKAKTFAKGGKVKGVKTLVKMFRARMDDREGYIREGRGETKEEAYENLRKEVARDNGEDTVDGLLKEHGVTYRGRE